MPRGGRGAVAALLGLTVSVLVLRGHPAAPRGSSTSSPRDSRARSARPPSRLVRILFPGAGLLVLSAWCLGVLNSHRRFFLSYAAPVVWNLAIIAALLASGDAVPRTSPGGNRRLGLGGGQPAPVRRPASDGARGSSAGFGPDRCSSEPVRHGGPQLRAGVRGARRGADQRVRGHGAREPAADRRGRGRVLRAGAYTLPVSLFGMSVSAAELPEMSSAAGTEAERAAYLRSAARRGAAADRVLRGSVGGGVPRAGRRGHRRALPVGRVHPRDDGLRLGHPGRRRGGSAAVDPRAALLLGLLRAARHPHAAPVSRWCGWASAIALGYLLALHLPRGAGARPRWGAAGHHARLGSRRPGRVSAAPARARRQDRRHRDSTAGTSRALGQRRWPRRRCAGRFEAALPCAASRSPWR